MLKKLSAVAASIVAFAFIFVSIAHACPSLGPVNLAVQQSFMNTMDGGNPPCSKEKSDPCKSVRDSILSEKPSMSGTDSPEQPVFPLQLPVESPSLLASSPITSTAPGAFHPVFKLPLTLSYVVLRI